VAWIRQVNPDGYEAGLGQDEAHRRGPETKVQARLLRRALVGKTEELLRDCVAKGHWRVAGDLLDGHPLLDPDGENTSGLLSWATQGSHRKSFEPTVRMLLEHEAKIDMPIHDNNHSCGWTAFWQAVHDNDLKACKLFLAHGARLDYQPENGSAEWGAFELAASCGNMGIMGWLLEEGVTVRSPETALSSLRDRWAHGPGGEDPKTLLHHLVEIDETNPNFAELMAYWLVEHGEKWEAKDLEGRTALQWAVASNSWNVAVFQKIEARLQNDGLEQATEAVGVGRRAKPRL
jgi:hypothetical protein